MEVAMPLVTLILGLLGGFIAGMIVAAGSWRKALGKLGTYAINAANAPPAPPAAPAPLAPPNEAATPAPSSQH
jgi:hypothetical protein